MNKTKLDQIIEKYPDHGEVEGGFRYEEVEDAAIQYAIAIVDMIVERRQELFSTWQNGQVYKNEAVIEELKQQIKEGKI